MRKRLDADIFGPSFNQAIIRTASYLGAEFAAYREVLANHNARWSKPDNGNLVPLERAAALVRDLRAAGFDVVLAPGLRDALAEVGAEARKQLAVAQKFMAARVGALAERSLTLRRYQLVGVEWLFGRERALLGDDMGLGKTIQALVALPDEAAAIVVCPSYLKLNWEEEVGMWRPDLRAQALFGRGSFRWPRRGEVLVINYDILPPTDEEVAKQKEGKARALAEMGIDSQLPGLADERRALPEVGTVLIADEAHLCKNPATNRTKRLAQVIEAVLNCRGRAWTMTGTPLANRGRELYDVLDLNGLAIDAFGGLGQFKRLMRDAEWRLSAGVGTKGLPVEIGDRLREVMLRRNKADVLRELPSKTRQKRVVSDLDATALAECEAALAALQERGLSAEQVAALVAGTKDSGASIELIAKVRSFLAMAKLPSLQKLLDDLEASGEQVVVFSAHRAPMEALAQREGWGLIVGGVSSQERQRVVARFQAEEMRGIAATIRAGGTGLTLTAACHVVFLDMEWTPAENLQAEDRLVRIGQHRAVTVTQIVADHAVDRMVMALLAEKLALFEATVCAAEVPEEHEPGESPAAERARATTAALAPEVDCYCPIEPGRQIRTAGRRRSAANAREDFVGLAIVQMSSEGRPARFDRDLLRSLAEQFGRAGMLTDRQWQAAGRLAHKYRAQVGEAPAVSPDGVALT